MSVDDVRALVDELGDIGTALATADPARKVDLYGDLGVQLTYRPVDDVVVADLAPPGLLRVSEGRLAA